MSATPDCFSIHLMFRGFQFTQKLEGMFKDMSISAEGAKTFRDYQQKHAVSYQSPS